MAGLLDFLKSPEGQGLVSGISGYAATARRGTPINNIGRGLLAGTAGLNTAFDKQKEVEKQQMMKSFFGMGAPAGASQNMPASGQQPMPAGVQQPMGAAQPAGLAGKSIDQIAAAKALMGIDVLEPWKVAQSGVPVSAGYRVVNGQLQHLPNVDKNMNYDPVSGQAYAVPGTIEAEAARAGATTAATERAKLPYAVEQDRARQTLSANLDVMKVVGADGNEYYVPRGQVAGFGGGVQGGGGVLNGGGQQQGQQGGYIASLNPVAQQSQQHLIKDFIDNTYRPVVSAGETAQSHLGSIAALRNINMQTGWGADAMAKGAEALASMGIKNAEKLATSAQQFNSVVYEKLMAEQKAQAGPQTEKDFKNIQQTWVKIGNTPQANAFILDLAEARANAAKRKAEFYGKAMSIADTRKDYLSVDAHWQKVQRSLFDDPVMQKWKPQQKTGS